MLGRQTLLGLLALSTQALGNYLPKATKFCQDYKIPVTVTSQDYTWNFPQFANNFDVTNLIVQLNSRETVLQLLSGTTTEVTGSFVISGRFCTPVSRRLGKQTVLLASHGLNYEKSYFDPTFNPGTYSFVDYAISLGHSVFFYDRLGVGESSRLSGFVNQESKQVAVLRYLANAIRAGKFTGALGVPDSLVLVGHSFGSGISAAALVAEPTLADALIMTGFSYNYLNYNPTALAIAPRIASLVSPWKWGRLDNGYLTFADIYANAAGFFRLPNYETGAIQYTQTFAQPYGIMELVSLSVINASATEFTGPVMLVTGARDFIYCSGLCDDTLSTTAAAIFAKSRAFKACSIVDAGHSLFFAKNAPLAFKEIGDFLIANGF